VKKIILKILKYSAAALLTLILFVLFLTYSPLPEPLHQNKGEGRFQISKVNIIDVANNSIVPDQTILIVNNRISKIANSDSISIDDSFTHIDGQGKFALAGLWDMHSHLGFQIAPQIVMPMHIANGVTSIRDMQGVVNINSDRRLWRDQIASGDLMGPRIIGFADEMVGDSYDERDVAEVVNRSAQDKNTFVKIYSGILSERYFQLAQRAKELGVDFAGHYPSALNPVDASNAGQKSFEHAHLFLSHSYPESDQIREFYRAMYANEEPDRTLLPSSAEMLANLDYTKFYELVDVMVKNDTYFCPTHITKQYEAMANDEAFLQDDRRKYIPPMISYMWQDDVNGTQKRDQEQRTVFYQKGLELTGLAQRKGVKILAGTDSYDPYSFPGFSLHSELEELVKAGLTPAQALAAATINPAEYFSVSEDYGTLQAGKMADFILLSNNPLENIKNTSSIDAVFFNGQHYDREALDGLLAYVEENVSGISGLSLTVKMFFRLMKDNTPEARNNPG